MAADNRPLDQIYDPRFLISMNIAQRMHLAMTRMDYVQKEKKDQMKYTIVSHDKVTALVRENTVACGIIYYVLGGSLVTERDGNMTSAKLTVRFENINDREDYIDVDGMGYGIDSQDKGPGKAISYSVKYALLKAFGLETGDDPDLDQQTERRSSAVERAVGIENQIAQATTAAELKLILTEPATQAVRTGLMRDDKAAYQQFMGAVKKAAARVELDLSTL